MHGLSRCILILCLILVAQPTLYAELVWPVADGTPVRVSDGITTDIQMSSNDNEYNITIWRDARSGDLEIYGQLSQGGTMLWADGGILLASSPGYQELGAVAALSDGFVFTWLDARRDPDLADAHDLYAQKVDLDGNLLWHDDDQPVERGVLVALGTDNGEVIDPFQVPAGDGGCYVGFGHSPANTSRLSQILLQKRLSNGEPDASWPEGGLLIDEAQPDGHIGNSPDACSDEQGGIIVSWTENVDLGNAVLITHVNPDASQDWNNGEPLPLSTEYDANQTFLQHVSDGNGGAFTVWNVGQVAIYLQKVSNTGELVWGDTGSLVSMSDNSGHPVLRAHNEMSAVLVWTDGSQEYGGRYIQRYAGGDTPVPMWGDEPVSFPTSAGTVQSVLVGNDGDTAVLTSSNLEDNLDLFHFDSDGVLLSPDTGVDVLPDDGELAAHPRLSRSWTGFFISYPAQVVEQRQIIVRRYLVENTILRDPIQLTGSFQGSSTESLSLPIEEGILTVWLDSRAYPTAFDGADAYCQVLDRDTGEPLLAEGGLPLISESDPFSPLKSALRFVAGEGDAFYTSFLRNDGLDGLKIQKFTADGTLLWGNTGKLYQPFEPDPEYFYNYELVALDEGGVVVAFDGGHQLRAQRFNEFGYSMWTNHPENYVTLTPEGEYAELQHQVQMENDDVMLLYSLRIGDDYELLMNRLTSAGEWAWNEPLLLSQDRVRWATLEKTADGLIVHWQRRNDNNPGLGGLYAHYVNNAGEPLWAGAISLGNATTQVNSQLAVRDSENEAFWHLWHSEDGPVPQLLLQRYSQDNGQPLLGDEPLVLTDIPNDASALSDQAVLAMEDGGVIVTWKDLPDGQSHGKIFYLRINADGSLPPGYEQPIRLAMTPGGQGAAKVVKDGVGGAYLHWNDTRASYGMGGDMIDVNLYAHRIHDDITSVELSAAAETPVDWQLGFAYPNPFNATSTITLTVPNRELIRIAVTDILGRQVALLHHGSVSPGTHRFAVDASDWASGIYFLRASGEGTAPMTRKLVVLK